MNFRAAGEFLLLTATVVVFLGVPGGLLAAIGYFMGGGIAIAILGVIGGIIGIAVLVGFIERD